MDREPIGRWPGTKKYLVWEARLESFFAGRPSRTWLVKTARLMTSVSPEEGDPKGRDQLACGALQSAARLPDPRPGRLVWQWGSNPQPGVQATDQGRAKVIDPTLVRSKQVLPGGNLALTLLVVLTVQVPLRGEHVDPAITQAPIGQTTQGAATLATEETGDRDENLFGEPCNPAMIGAMSMKPVRVVALRTVGGGWDLVVVVA